METTEKLTVRGVKVHGFSSWVGVEPGYTTPIEAMKGPLEKILYVIVVYTCTNLHEIYFLQAIIIQY